MEGLFLQAAESFDLTAARARWVRGHRFDAPIGALAALFLGVLAVYRLLVPSPDWSDFALGFIGLAGAATIAYILIFLGHRLPSRLLIDQTGVAFMFPNGPDVRLAWADPKFRIVFRDMRYRADALEHPEKFDTLVLGTLGGFSFRPLPLTVEAFVALLESSEAHGLLVTPWNWSRPVDGERRVVVEAIEPHAAAS